ncbi:hypothetical protein RAL92_17105 [Metapseudomonas otitidis]|uniref:hypothetical protein n=1 Tax=Metapseudomonas otitidis TaxID=319939 RepID=UPI0032166AE8
MIQKKITEYILSTCAEETYDLPPNTLRTSIEKKLEQSHKIIHTQNRSHLFPKKIALAHTHFIEIKGEQPTEYRIRTRTSDRIIVGFLVALGTLAVIAGILLVTTDLLAPSPNTHHSRTGIAIIVIGVVFHLFPRGLYRVMKWISRVSHSTSEIGQVHPKDPEKP